MLLFLMLVVIGITMAYRWVGNKFRLGRWELCSGIAAALVLATLSFGVGWKSSKSPFSRFCAGSIGPLSKSSNRRSRLGSAGKREDCASQFLHRSRSASGASRVSSLTVRSFNNPLCASFLRGRL